MKTRSRTYVPLVTVFSGFVVWLASFALLAPLRRVHAAVRRSSQRPDEPLQLPAMPADEIGELASALGRYEQTLHERENELNLVLKASPLGMFRCNADGTVTTVNPTYRQYLWLTGQCAPVSWLDWVADEERELASAWWHKALSSESNQVRRVTLRRGDCCRVVVVRVAPIRVHGRLAGYSGTLADVTEQHANELALRRQVQLDPLTQLPNRAGFEAELDRTFRYAAEYGTPFAVAFLDMDKFKSINDTHGHLVGDELLKEFGTRVRTSLRESDVVCRLGGDEFTLILPGVGSEGAAAAIGDKLVSAMAEPFHIGDIELQLTTSIGIALYTGCPDCLPRNLVARADQLLYEAKAGGRNAYRIGDCIEHAVSRSLGGWAA